MAQKTLPYTLSQNPAPNTAEQGQAYQQDKTVLTQEIMAAFRAVLPSNYVAVTNGPWYSLQFQAIAEQLAAIQISASEVFEDSGWDFTRPDFLWETLGTLIFPGARDKSGIPVINGDIDYRAFLQTMASLLLEGATKSSIEQGLEALNPNITAYVLERYLQTPPRDPNGAYTIADQFALDILLDAGNQFPDNPVALERNVALVLAALKPAHVLYTYSTLFRDYFPVPEDQVLSIDADEYFYEDGRKYCFGAKEVSGTAGSFLTQRQFFSDPSRSFSSIPEQGAAVLKAAGSSYRVKSKKALIAGADSTLRAYTTSPSGLTGFVLALNQTDLQDSLQDWGGAVEDEVIEILTGPNAGFYRLETVLGSTGGPLGQPGLAGDRVRLSYSILELYERGPVGSSLTYTVTVDRLGQQPVREVLAEDVTSQFWL